MTRSIEMCIINPALVEDIAELVGSQSQIMVRIGISWNSWIKIIAGMPIRLSVGLRLKAQLLARADTLDGIRRKYPSSTEADGIDRARLDRECLRRVLGTAEVRKLAYPPPRSIKAALSRMGEASPAYQ